MSAKALPDAQARLDALSLDVHALVMAPAGSGKTGLLVHRMLRALAVVDVPEEVVAITFTRKAAAEVSTRVLEILRDAAVAVEEPGSEHERALLISARAVLQRDREKDWQLLAHPARINALTIDAFCAQLGAQLPLLSGLGGSIAISDDARSLYLDAITRLFDEIEDASVPQQDRDALARVLRLSGNRLDRLIEPLSTLLASREQWLYAAAAQDEQDWRTKDAQALESLVGQVMQEFNDVIDAQERESLISAFREAAAHAPAMQWAQDLQHWPQDDQHSLQKLAASLLTGDGKLRKKGGINKTSGFPPKSACKAQFQAFLEGREGDDELEAKALAMCQVPDPDLPADMHELRMCWLRVLRRLAAHLRVIFASAGQADFGQLAQSALQALRPEGSYGDALLQADHQLRHLLVDEMQDTSETQLRLIESLTASWTPGDGRSLFLVGDPQQSIYAFRKAEVRLFLKLWDRAQLGELVLSRLRLSANFRSEPAVVEWFNTAFERVFPDRADEQRGAVAFTSSVALRAPSSDESGVSVHLFSHPGEEAVAAATRAASLVSEQASVVVLAQTRRALEPVIRALRAQGLTPHCQDIDPLAALPEVRDVMALAQALWHPQDRLSWAVLLRAPFVGLSWSQMLRISVGRHKSAWPERIAAALDEQLLDDEGHQRLLRLMNALQSTEATSSIREDLALRCETIWHELAGPACCSRAALDDVRQAFQCLREETRGSGIRDIEGLRRKLEKLYAAPRAGQVQLMTIHKAKGLEFDHVLLVGCNARTRSEERPVLHFGELGQAQLLVPKPDEAWPEDHAGHRAFNYLHALHVASRQNERLRVLYVAITRAKRTADLFLSAEQDKDGNPRLHAHSFASLLQPIIGETITTHFAQLAPAAATSGINEAPPIAPRLPLNVQLPQESGLYRPQEVRTLRPSEAVLREQAAEDQQGADDGNLYAQLLGTLYHEAMQRIAEEGMDKWTDAGSSRRKAMSAGLRRRGMPEPQVDGAVDRVIALLRRTLDSPHGQWLLKPRAWARSEYPLAGMDNGRWISAIVDRCFEDDEGVIWVIDYKTTSEAVPAEQVETYAENARRQYQPQLARYVDMLGKLRAGKTVRGALYLAETDQLVEVAATTS